MIILGNPEGLNEKCIESARLLMLTLPLIKQREKVFQITMCIGFAEVRDLLLVTNRFESKWFRLPLLLADGR